MTKKELAKRLARLKELRAFYKDGAISVEDVMTELGKMGYCVNLLNDDNGHWAFASDGYQSVPSGKYAENIQTSFFIEKKKWKTTIRAALIHFFNTDLLDD